MSALPEPSLQELEALAAAAIRSGDDSALTVLGYGEISTVIAWEGRACKRLPPFPDQGTFEAYAATFQHYLDTLNGAGCKVVDSVLQHLPSDDGRVSVWCVQPMLDPSTFLPEKLRGPDGERFLEPLVERIVGTVSPMVGLDAQASNWVWVDGELAYLDVTTPMLRDGEGKEQLDTALFLASLPWALRSTVRRFLLGSILDKYYEPRGALVDLAGNLVKEGLGERIEPLMDLANAHVDPPITRKEVEAYYRDDARMWELLQRLRRVDRWWQRTVRRRPYPFLLPGEVERRV